MSKTMKSKEPLEHPRIPKSEIISSTNNPSHILRFLYNVCAASFEKVDLGGTPLQDHLLIVSKEPKGLLEKDRDEAYVIYMTNTLLEGARKKNQGSGFTFYDEIFQLLELNLKERLPYHQIKFSKSKMNEYGIESEFSVLNFSFKIGSKTEETALEMIEKDPFLMNRVWFDGDEIKGYKDSFQALKNGSADIEHINHPVKTLKMLYKYESGGNFYLPFVYKRLLHFRIFGILEDQRGKTKYEVLQKLTDKKNLSFKYAQKEGNVEDLMLKIVENESSAEVFESFLNDYNHFRGMKLSSSYSLFKDVFREQRVISGFKRKELEELFDESKELPFPKEIEVANFPVHTDNQQSEMGAEETEELTVLWNKIKMYARFSGEEYTSRKELVESFFENFETSDYKEPKALLSAVDQMFIHKRDEDKNQWKRETLRNLLPKEETMVKDIRERAVLKLDINVDILNREDSTSVRYTLETSTGKVKTLVDFKEGSVSFEPVDGSDMSIEEVLCHNRKEKVVKKVSEVLQEDLTLAKEPADNRMLS